MTGNVIAVAAPIVRSIAAAVNGGEQQRRRAGVAVHRLQCLPEDPEVFVAEAGRVQVVVVAARVATRVSAVERDEQHAGAGLLQVLERREKRQLVGADAL